ncbi:MAG: hypothetical protein ACHQRM_10675 [Bacteroidia bacterium]
MKKQPIERDLVYKARRVSPSEIPVLPHEFPGRPEEDEPDPFDVPEEEPDEDWDQANKGGL